MENVNNRRKVSNGRRLIYNFSVIWRVRTQQHNHLWFDSSNHVMLGSTKNEVISLIKALNFDDSNWKTGINILNHISEIYRKALTKEKCTLKTNIYIKTSKDYQCPHVCINFCFQIGFFSSGLKNV